MDKCCVRGCRKRGAIDFQTRRWSPGQKTLQSWRFCYSHGFYMTRAEIDFELERSFKLDSKNKPNYRQRAKVTAQSDSTLAKLAEHKDSLTIQNYQSLIGKRFRMTKDQKERGISRDEALAEFLDSLEV